MTHAMQRLAPIDTVYLHSTKRVKTVLIRTNRFYIKFEHK